MGITTGMAIAAGVSAASSLAGGAMAKSASKKASRAQVQASQDANAAQERMFQRQIELQEPFRQGGMTAQQEIMQLLGIGGDKAAAGYGSMAKAFGTDQFQQDPGYAFRQAEGMKALERSAAARGNLLSGSTLKGVQRFGQDLASQEYQNAFNRFQVERSARLNPLQSLMGSGQSAEQSMQLDYEAVTYNTGFVSQGNPPGFGVEHYDTMPSPLSIFGGGTRTLFGQGGVLAGAEAVFGALGSGKAFDSPANFISTAIAAVNTYQNAKSLTKTGVGSELTGAAIRGLQTAAVIGLSGQNTISFPVNNPTATTSARPIQFGGGNGP